MKAKTPTESSFIYLERESGNMNKILDRVNSNKDLKKLSLKELEVLSDEIRDLLIDVVSKNGGHLASNLGVVEMTIALHYVFDSPIDKILWDVGHQAYVHKILTDRKERIYTIRKKGGLGPFTNPKESIHDPFIAGHAGNIISAAYGIMEAEKDKDNKIVAIVGDASLSSGQSMEAINNAGGKAENLIVIINDNEMSIGENVGAMFQYLNKILSKNFYNKIKEDVETNIRKVPFGNSVADVIKRLEHSVRYFLYPGSVFEELGFDYIGPIDGHYLPELVGTFKEVKERKGPILIHIKTDKGKGYNHAEENKEKFHGISPFDVRTGEVNSKKEGYSNIFGRVLTEIAEQRNDIIAICSGMISGTGLTKFFDKFPDRAYDVGIAEEHAVTFAGGLAISGKKPVVAIYSTFLQRGYDQIVHDIALQKLNVMFILDRAGIVGEDGATHNGIFDISYLSHIPGVTIMAPSSREELEQSIKFGVDFNKGPLFIRIPRSEVYIEESVPIIEYGKWREIKKGSDILIIAVGSMVDKIVELYPLFKERELNPTVVSALFVKPFDTEYLINNIEKYDKIVCIEENVLHGGLGSMLLEFINDNRIAKTITRIGLKDEFIEHGSRNEILEELGLNGISLFEKIIK